MGESSVTGLQPGKTEQYLCHTLNVIAAILDDALRLVQPQCFRRVVQNGGNGRRIALLKQLIRRPQASWLFDVELRVAIYILSFSHFIIRSRIRTEAANNNLAPEDVSPRTHHKRLNMAAFRTASGAAASAVASAVTAGAQSAKRPLSIKEEAGLPASPPPVPTRKR